MKLAISSAMLTVMLAAPAVFAQDGQVYQNRTQEQQSRINNGAADGQLSAHQTAHLENNQAKINGEIAKDKTANGGSLTKGEKVQVHHQLKEQSHAIARKKHDQ